MMEDKQKGEAKANKQQQAGTMKRGGWYRRVWHKWAKKQADLTDTPRAVTKADAPVREMLARLCFTHNYFLCSARGCPMVGKFNVVKTYYNRRGLLCGLCAKLALPGSQDDVIKGTR